MSLFELSNANLSSTALRFISHAFTPRRVEQSTRGLFIQQKVNIRSHTAEFKLQAFSVVLVCCVGIPHSHFVRLVSSEHSLPILYFFCTYCCARVRKQFLLPASFYYKFATPSMYLMKLNYSARRKNGQSKIEKTGNKAS